MENKKQRMDSHGDGTRVEPIESGAPYNPFSEKSNITDIALVVEGTKLHVSTHVLSLVSPVFRAMFATEMKEKHIKEIPLPEKKLADFIEFLLCVYPDTLKAVEASTAHQLLPLFDCYQMDNQTLACEKVLISSLTRDSNIDIVLKNLLFSSTFNAAALKTHCIKLAARQKTDVLETRVVQSQLTVALKAELWHETTRARDFDVANAVPNYLEEEAAAHYAHDQDQYN